MTADSSPRLITIGQLTRDFIITPAGCTVLDIPGGDAIFSAAGMCFWNESPGICARVSELYPESWIDTFEENRINTLGIIPHPDISELIRFYAYSEPEIVTQDNPITHFAQMDLPIPKTLLGYTNPIQQNDSQTQIDVHNVHPRDVPTIYLDAIASHLCSLDYAAYNTLLHILKQGGVHTISIDPGMGTMNSMFFDLVPNLIRDAAIFHTSETKIRQLFYGHTEDLWEMASQIGEWGSEIVAIRCGRQGQILYDSASKKRWIIPAYPSQENDPTGAGAVFCGGFLAGYLTHYDALMACLMGSIASSFSIEGSGPLYILNTMPGLAQRRLELLQENVKMI